MIAGGGVHYAGARDALAAFSDAFGVPVAETSAGKGAGAGCALALGAVGHPARARATRSRARPTSCSASVPRLIDLTTGSNSLFEDPGVRFVGLNLLAPTPASSAASRCWPTPAAVLEQLSGALAQVGWQVPAGVGARARTALARVARRRRREPRRAARRAVAGQALRVLNQQARAGDTLVVASGTPHVDVHKLWETRAGVDVQMEVGFSCMGHEIPAGARRADRPPARRRGLRADRRRHLADGPHRAGDGRPGAAEGDGAGRREPRLPVDPRAQRARTGRSFGLEFRAPRGRGRRRRCRARAG